TYEEAFRKLRPDLPSDWRVHHTIQKYNDVLTARFATEKGININDPKYLRGLPQSVHGAIGGEQTAWWNMQRRVNNKTPANIDLDVVLKFVSDQEKEYATRWVKSVPKPNDIAKVKNVVKTQSNLFVLDKPNRWNRLGIGVVAFAFFNLANSQGRVL